MQSFNFVHTYSCIPTFFVNESETRDLIFEFLNLLVCNKIHLLYVVVQ